MAPARQLPVRVVFLRFLREGHALLDERAEAAIAVEAELEAVIGVGEPPVAVGAAGRHVAVDQPDSRRER